MLLGRLIHHSFNSVKAILINTFAIGKMVKILFGVLILQKTSDFSELLYRILDSHHINSDQLIWIFLIRTDLDRLAWPYYNGFFSAVPAPEHIPLGGYKGFLCFPGRKSDWDSRDT